MPAVVQWILAGITLVTFLAAAAVFLRGSADKGTITSLQNSVSALKTEGELKDHKIADLTNEVADLKRLREADRARIVALEKVVTSADLITHLQADLNEHHNAVIDILSKIARKVGAIHA